MVKYCKCQGQIHKFKANCVSCGIVLCSLHDNQICPFCTSDLSGVVDEDSLSSKVENIILYRDKLIGNQDSNSQILSINDENTIDEVKE